MKEVFDFVEGKMSFDEFEAELYLKPEIWKWLQALVPSDIENPECRFRKEHGKELSSFITNNYSVKKTIMSLGYNGMSAHHLISELVKYNYPDIVVAMPQSYSYFDMLEKMNLTYIDSDNNEKLIKSILSDAGYKTVKDKKNALKEAFHIKPGKYPRWVQEPEWPWGVDSPMQFVEQKRNGEEVTYTFKDVTTGEIRKVVQFY